MPASTGPRALWKASTPAPSFKKGTMMEICSSRAGSRRKVSDIFGTSYSGVRSTHLPRIGTAVDIHSHMHHRRLVRIQAAPLGQAVQQGDGRAFRLEQGPGDVVLRQEFL